MRATRFPAAWLFVLVLVVGSSLTSLATTSAEACHGKGVSRTCFSNPARLESVSYEPNLDINYHYDWVFVSSNYHFWGDDCWCNSWGRDQFLVYSDWHAVAGRWVGGSWTSYKVQGSHSFQHDGVGYGLPYSYGVYCAAPTVDGC
jgi:hypothetical protein